MDCMGYINAVLVNSMVLGILCKTVYIDLLLITTIFFYYTIIYVHVFCVVVSESLMFYLLNH